MKALPDIAPLTISDEKNRGSAVQSTPSVSCDSVRWVTGYQDDPSAQNSPRLKAGKKITAVDDRYMRIAKDNLYGELAVVLHKKPDENLIPTSGSGQAGSAEAAQ